MWIDNMVCPYCGHKNDDTEVIHEIDNNNNAEWECENCEEIFNLEVDFIVKYKVSKMY